MSESFSHPAVVFFCILGAGAVVLLGLYVHTGKMRMANLLA